MTLSNPATAAGERYDDASGLQYLNARYYDPKLAMFIQPDWWEVMQEGVGTNRCGYSFSDPVNGRDPSGHCFEDLCIGEAIIARLAIQAVMEAIAIGFSIDQMSELTPEELALGLPAGFSTTPQGPMALANPIENFPIELEGFSTTPEVGGSIVSTPVASGGDITITTKETGSYTIDFPDGTRYHGKGGLARAKSSARRIAKQKGYDIEKTEVDWSRAESDREAFKAEHERIEGDNGVENKANHNKRNSPGKKYADEDDSPQGR